MATKFHLKKNENIGFDFRFIDLYNTKKNIKK